MGIMKDFLAYPDRNPSASWIQVAIWFTILGSSVVGGLLGIFILIAFAPWWIILFVIGGWISFSFYYYWYYEISKKDSINNRYERDTE